MNGRIEPARYRVVAVQADRRDYLYGDASFRERFAAELVGRANEKAGHVNEINPNLVRYETEPA